MTAKILNQKNIGFTIVELVIVIAIIGILAAIAIVSYNGIQKQAIDKSISSDIDGVEGEISRYSTKNDGIYGSGIQWYSGGASNANIQFKPSPNTVIDVVSDSAGYCIRAYNPGATTNKDLASAQTKGLSSSDCTRLAASNAAQGVSSGLLALTTPSTSPNYDFRVAGSADGTKAIAVAGAQLAYTTTNSGATWSPRVSLGSNQWRDVASSSDGSKLYAVSSDYMDVGKLFVSSDSGATWTNRTQAGNPSYRNIATSSDGTKAVVAAVDLNADPVVTNFYTTTNSGQNWTFRTSYELFTSSVVMSSDGTKIAFSPTDFNYIYTSSDSGVTYTARTGTGIKSWANVAMSSDGTKLIGATQNNYIYTSTDSGATWTQHTSLGTGYWRAGISGDGTKLYAAKNAGLIYVSANGGTSWTPQTAIGSKSWSIPAVSSDGLKIFIPADYIYTGVYTP